MTRSIHDTWGELARVRRADWSNSEHPAELEATLLANARRQRAWRASEGRLRRQGGVALQPVDPASVPILVEDEAPWVFHPATVEDVRSLLRSLPPGSLDGLQRLRLCVDQAHATEGNCVREPFTGRLRYEVSAGVYVSYAAGDYDPDTATVRVFAVVCEPSKLGPLALYFKLDALCTVVHEAAHHFDTAFRTGRSRWDLSVPEKREAWAERVEAEQSLDLVVPLVRERYARECRELEAWVEAHGGVPLPLVALVGATRGAFLALARRVSAGEPPDTARVGFARALHFEGENASARAVVASLLASQPEHPDALALSACLVQCVEREFATGEALCRRALAADPRCVEAWSTLIRGFELQRQWERVASTCEEALHTFPTDAPDDPRVERFRARLSAAQRRLSAPP